MQEKRYIEIEQEDGTLKQAELILTFHLDSTNKDYMVYSFDETDDHDSTILYTAEVLWNEDESCSLNKIDDPKTWNEIKELMRNLIKKSSEE
ncbi:MAG TPA: DUF1292 domain-containing protein [Candidatus Fimihabitans intestinipullorum]|uniref:DUF1292 domain-containing protein n=1 Tax=Candidatus Fimihabitans intestinipullorum TaxID=2840820 RepID=A0A9D1HVD1_9BACT|nr:DUF1292 domain-containing protein [Candidatus Fimihabitans intestinipullorum]